MEKSPESMLRAAGRGDPDAWRRLVEAYSGRVFGLVLRQCGDRDLAEEITQATFVRIVQKLGSYEEQGKFEAWLFRIAINHLRDEIRRRKRHGVTLDFDATPPESLGHADHDTKPDGRLEEQERHAQLHAAMAQLPESDRQLLHLRYTAELTFAQIAQMLDEPLGTVLARGHRALKKMRQIMTDREPHKAAS